MQLKNIFFILGLLTICLALFLLFPSIVSFIYNEDKTLSLFIKCFFATLSGGIVLALVSKPQNGEKIQLTTRDGVAIVGLCWIFASFICALPYYYITEISFAKSLFESASGLSTTGGSIFPDVEILPKGILFWRSFTQWIGGMGIIVFSLALLPIIGAGGMQLYKAETPGVNKDKVAPKMIDTARSLWTIYLVLTLTLIGILYLQGLSFFDALTHSLSTLSTGGFSTKNESVAAFGPVTQWTMVFFMYLGSVNFTLHFLFLHDGIKAYFRNEEWLCYTLYLFVGIFLIAVCLYFTDTHAQYFLHHEKSIYTMERALRDAAFQLVSLMTSSGFVTADYMQWPLFTHLIILVSIICGGCAASTSGGMKFMRVMIIFKLIKNELNRLSHPRSIERVKINGNSLDDAAIKSVLTFFALYIISIALGTFFLTTPFLDLETSFSATISCISNIGPALGMLGPTNNFSIFNDFDLTVLSFLMIYGRLEIFTILLLFMPKFWRY